MQSATLEITLDASGSSIEKVDNSNISNNTSSGNNVNAKQSSSNSTKNNNKHTINNTTTINDDTAIGGGAADGNKLVNSNKSSKIRAGENKFEFALDIKGGPAVVLLCRCYIATPSLRVTPS